LAERLAALPAKHFEHFAPLIAMLEEFLSPRKATTGHIARLEVSPAI
jgi:hypothetical protein